MQTPEHRYHDWFSGIWLGLMQRLVYLPGAIVLIYGFWLSLTV